MRLVSLCFLVCFLIVSCSAQLQEDPYAAYRPLSEHGIYTRAQVNLDKKNYADAIVQFEALDTIYPFSKDTKKAQLDIIYAYFQNNQDTEASVAADRYLRLYPSDKNLDYVYYMRGLINIVQGRSWLQNKFGVNVGDRNLSRFKMAFYNFDSVVRYFPHSIYAPSAYYYLSVIRNLSAGHMYTVAQFYFDRSAYVAAANRATMVLQSYPRSPYVFDALKLLRKSYHVLKLPAKEAAVTRILQQNLHKTLN